uniref:phosphoglycerate dehydrogenase n=1 Tax=uncultured marine microorganism HF4000_APKG7H23 TaxID=455551 RepID=B3T9W6_9ZZZZ|nr:putative D-isomer specific 2-hydroxyacid dehydrogenase, NAD binding domain protein [uncultured marine microorganism HF4000_APKG7H23]
MQEIIGGYEALIVRSETQVTAGLIEAGGHLQVIGRAGVGVDNVDLDAATRQGIPVVNAPTGNTVAAAEHTLALMLAMVRHIPQADASVRMGEWRRSAFMGVEVRGKILGIIGLGKVGSEVARRTRALQMRILAHDPFVPQESARSLGVEMVSLDQLMAEADFITIHTPLTATTQQLLGPAQFQQLKHGVRIINAARGGLVNEQLLLEALESGRVAGAALDVFVEEPPKQSPLLQHPRVVLTPHLGASTEEAQTEVALEIADQVLAVLAGSSAQYTVNVPYIPEEVREALAPFIPVATFLGKVAIQLAEGQFESLTLSYSGEIAHYDTSLLKAAALVGILGHISSERVNLVNAPVFAQQRGVKVFEQKEENGTQRTNLMSVEVRTSQGSTRLGGTSVNDQVHLVRVNDFSLDLQPTGRFMMFTEHTDRPGMIGRMGTIAGEHDINISFMEVGRRAPRGEATMIVGLDDPISDEALAEFRAIPHVSRVRVVAI